MGEAKDDIHVCIMCLRSIMINKYGLNMVIQHREAINCVALSLVHKSLRTKALVLELLAAICLVKGGHEIVISAFDNFKDVCHETSRFHTLMEYFINYQVFHIEFMVACMKFVNIVVHSAEGMNLRVQLQYEFTKLGLGDYLQKLKHTEIKELEVQICAYLDNAFDVATLMKDGETNTAALEKVAELEDELGHAHERLAETEGESLAKMAELQTELGAIRSERDGLLKDRRRVVEEVNTLRRAVMQQQQPQQESQKKQSMPQNKIMELEALTRTLAGGSSSGGDSSKSSSVPIPPPPPPPPPLSSSRGSAAPVPPPPIGMMQAPDGAMTMKRKVQTKYKLPTLNWTALKPHQVGGTVFSELDDDRLHGVINFGDFEERFKIGTGISFRSRDTDVDGLVSFPINRVKRTEKVSLLEHTRLRNVAISRRKLKMSAEKVIAAVNALDLKLLSLENVEILKGMVPTDQETKAYREYVGSKKNVNLLTEEDKFLLQLGQVERISAKLNIMSYIGNFFDNVDLITPQIHAIISASSSVRSSKKLRRLLEIILAFGNYLNSCKRGAAYGFKLQSLDALLGTKSTDKKMSLLHYIVETVRHKFPELLNFHSELMYIDKAAIVCLENIVSDVQELEKGMDMVRKEAGLGGTVKERGSGQSVVLRDFLAQSEVKLRKLQADGRSAQDAFRECVEYFGESARTTDASTFFPVLVRFARDFKLADQENEQRRKLELAALEALTKRNGVVMKRSKLNQKKQ
jgi:hypothetical protein